MVFMPNETTGKMRKLARRHHGPIQTHPNGVTVRPVDKHKDPLENGSPSSKRTP